MTDIGRILEQELTPGQRAAAVDTAAEILTLACAGSGKSRTLAYRIARLLAEGVPPASIVAFTFTEKAADTIKRRVAHALLRVGMDPTVMGAMYIGTIHSYCHYILGEIDAVHRQFDVLDENRLKLYLVSRYSPLGLHALHGRANQRYFEVIRQVSDAWKTANDEGIDLDAVAAEDATLGAVLVYASCRPMFSRRGQRASLWARRSACRHRIKGGGSSGSGARRGGGPCARSWGAGVPRT